MSHLAENILTAALAMPEGGLVSPKEFLHLASRAAIDKALSRLVQEGKLMRVSRGAYVAPRQGRFGERPPSTEAVIHAIEVQSGETVVPNGAAEANALDLTQSPTREVFFTSGSSRKLQLGNRSVELKHGNRWQLLLGKRPAGKAIRAVSWLGPEAAPAALKQLRSKLPESEWEALRSARAMLPSWLAKAVSEAVMGGS
ncbi:MAG: type IV toxin-antitoxin system AbiEi family antitoxin domain-containing protein [Cellvibrionales bacterium]|nr:type IV toxin-antitoxin system AbiEi family antitoxin domain-containing protein [Cellvibrionales bacterium]